jgi:hypothetical protein
VAQVSPVEPPPPGGLGLVGPGAQAAARGALVAALASGAVHDPDARTVVVIPAATVATLLGAHAAALDTWPRLHVTPNLDTALAVLHTRLLHAERLLAEYEVDDVATLREIAPYEEPLPPMLLIADTPPPGARVRTRTILDLGARVEITAVLLGPWDTDATLTVDAAGTYQATATGHTPRTTGRIAVLDAASADDLLRTLREAHTGQPDPAIAPLASAPPGTDQPGIEQPGIEQPGRTGPEDTPQAGGPTPPAEPKTRTAPADHPPQPGHQRPDSPGPAADRAPAVVTPAPPAVIRVLGAPGIDNRPAGVKARSAAIELMVYLATHPDGAHADKIMDEMYPAVRRRASAARVHTAASNLRSLLAGAAGGSREDYLVKQRGRYRLNPDTVRVDLGRCAPRTPAPPPPETRRPDWPPCGKPARPTEATSPTAATTSGSPATAKPCAASPSTRTPPQPPRSPTPTPPKQPSCCAPPPPTTRSTSRSASKPCAPATASATPTQSPPCCATTPPR